MLRRESISDFSEPACSTCFAIKASAEHPTEHSYGVRVDDRCSLSAVKCKCGGGRVGSDTRKSLQFSFVARKSPIGLAQQPGKTSN